MSAGRAFRRRLRSEPVIFLEPALSDDLPSPVKNALVARRQANRTGRCPSCGAELTIAGTGRVWSGVFEHETGCPVADPLGAAG